MTNLSNVNGHCLCGDIRFIVEKMKHTLCACHCNNCRRWGGGPLFSVDCGTEVNFFSPEKISIYQSSEWAERGFCQHCGSHLFYRFKENNKYFMPIGLFEQQEGIVFDHQIFIDEKPQYYCFANDTQNMTGKEVVELFLNKL